jgi:hypothetical protein
MSYAFCLSRRDRFGGITEQSLRTLLLYGIVLAEYSHTFDKCDAPVVLRWKHSLLMFLVLAEHSHPFEDMFKTNRPFGLGGPTSRSRTG